MYTIYGILTNGCIAMKSIQTISVPYGKSNMELHVDSKNLHAVLTSSFSHATSPIPADEIIRDAIHNPISSPALSELAAGKKNILIVTSDHTRPMPSRVTLPILTGELLKASPEAQITILIATGLHRAPTQDELNEKFGTELLRRFKFVVHDAFASEEMCFVKTLRSGTRFEVNRLAVETELLITEGFIEPHFFAGFSGGRKSILPGISSAVSISENHSALAINHPSSRCGILDGNPIHEDMVEAARSVNVAFSLNVALNGHKEIIAAFAGDLVEAHKAGCAYVSELCTVPRKTGDIVITTNGGYPLDQNLYQCPKSISTAAECANEGAVIIVAASCMDGYGGEYFRELITFGKPEDILAYLLSIPPSETIPEQWCAQIFARIMLHCRIIVVTDHMSSDELAAANMLHATTLDEALELAIQIKGVNARVVVIPDGISTIVSNV